MILKKGVFLLVFLLSIMTLASASIIPSDVEADLPQNSGFEVEVDNVTIVQSSDSTSNQSEQNSDGTRTKVKAGFQKIYDVIVVGSGIGGMAAAYELAQNNQKVLVLEANDYIGGRLKSTPITLYDNQTFNFELGANWIHGNSDANPIVKLAKNITGAQYIQTDYESMVTYDESGRSIDDQADKQWTQYEKIKEKLDKYENLSAYDAIKKINPSKVQNKNFMFHASYDLEFETSGTLQDLSAQWGQDDEAFDGEDELIISRYQAFAEHLSKHNNIKVLLEHKVTQVKSNNQNSSVIKCENGQTFSGKKVIIAVPIGVLKSQSIKFTPNLPSQKLEAIQKLHMGNVCKILIVPNKKIKIKNKEHFVGVVSNNVEERGAATYFVNIQSLAKLPALMTFGLGPNSDSLQSMPQTQLKQLIAQRLNAFVNGITENDFQIHRSGWRGNANFRGAYTYASVDAKPKHWQWMAKPVFKTGWYFCGQHTHSLYRGTVHGAYLSGVAAAKDLQNNVSSSNWQYAGQS